MPSKFELPVCIVEFLSRQLHDFTYSLDAFGVVGIKSPIAEGFSGLCLLVSYKSKILFFLWPEVSDQPGRWWRLDPMSQVVLTR